MKKKFRIPKRRERATRLKKIIRRPTRLSGAKAKNERKLGVQRKKEGQAKQTVYFSGRMGTKLQPNRGDHGGSGAGKPPSGGKRYAVTGGNRCSVNEGQRRNCRGDFFE